MNIVIFILVLAFAMYSFFYKKQNEEFEIDSSLLKPVFKQYVNFLGFGMMISILGWFIFKEALLLWFFFYTSIVAVLLISLAQKKDRLKSFSIGSLVFAVVFCILRVPTHPDSFQQWLGENKQLYCPSGFDCVKVSTSIEGENLVTKSEIVPIHFYDMNWYLLFATGDFSYIDSDGNEVQYEGVNIAGWWFETSN
ncbi:hypothetical protein V7138_22430 [Bacillus sp. JJ1533]|uniref:hypothetical protein n=1 Tax=Bacillus sp. JJ1533 TaxID=3122959 RepID=UPI003000E66C